MMLCPWLESQNPGRIQRRSPIALQAAARGHHLGCNKIDNFPDLFCAAASCVGEPHARAKKKNSDDARKRRLHDRRCEQGSNPHTQSDTRGSGAATNTDEGNLVQLRLCRRRAGQKEENTSRRWKNVVRRARGERLWVDVDGTEHSSDVSLYFINFLWWTEKRRTKKIRNDGYIARSTERLVHFSRLHGVKWRDPSSHTFARQKLYHFNHHRKWFLFNLLGLGWCRGAGSERERRAIHTFWL